MIFRKYAPQVRLLACALVHQRALIILAVAFACAHGRAFGQAYASLQGTITDASGAALPHAKIVAHNQATGEERSSQSDGDGLYAMPSLPVGTYRVEVTATGMQNLTVNGLQLGVGQVVAQNLQLRVASGNETVEVSAASPMIDTASTSVGQEMNSRAVQNIPLNGRHFTDLGFLIPGSMTPPQNAGQAAPLRGQGFFGFNTAGGRDDTINLMVNGINLNDYGGGNQFLFQPDVGTIGEFNVVNSTFSAEYGFRSGGILNMVTRSGTNEWHGEVFDFFRNFGLDARNYTNPITRPAATFHRNQFGGDGGGPIRKDKTFVYFSYGALRQDQGVPLTATVLSAAQRQQALASDAVIQKLLTLIPAANSAGNVYLSTTKAPVTNDQGSITLSHSFSDANRLSVYYAYQADFRNEPSSTSGNNLPGYGDLRTGRRQILTVSDTQVLSGTTVNEFHVGYNRIHLPFNPQTTLEAASYGIDTNSVSFPQISIGGGTLEFGGVNNEPIFRGDYTAVLSDNLNWVRGNHTVKVGGEFRRDSNNNYSYTPGTFSFPTIAAFLADQANSFTANNSNRSSRIFSDALAVFVQDAYKVRPNLLLELGLRYDWNGTPVEAEKRFSVFDPSTVSLLQVGSPGGPAKAYNQNALNFEPRVGLSWDMFGHGKSVLRTAYSIIVDSPNTSQVTPLAQNPPFATPLTYSPTAAIPYVSFADAYQLASGSVAPSSITPNYKNDSVQSYNLNLQQQITHSTSMMVGFFGTKGTHLNIDVNENQLVNKVRPYRALSATSPILPGKTLGNITLQTSGGNSNYNALWATLTQRMAHGLQFNASYNWSKSFDYNSRTAEGVTVQDSNNIRGDYGLSDFDARNRFVFSANYDLPLGNGRLRSGWEIAPIVTLQSGNPITFKTTNTSFTGVATLRPSVTGKVYTGFAPPTNLNPAYVTYLLNPTVIYDQGAAFGNMRRNVIIGPGFEDVDLGLQKVTHLSDKFSLQLRADAFDLLNHPNLGQPNSTAGSSTFGLISSTRFPTGDSGSSRQMQLSAKFLF